MNGASKDRANGVYETLKIKLGSIDLNITSEEHHTPVQIDDQTEPKAKKNRGICSGRAATSVKAWIPPLIQHRPSR